MSPDTELILTELRELRAEVNINAVSSGERLASLETSMKGLIGNGNPGRITLLERAVDRLQQWRWWIMGAAAGVSGVVTCIAWLIFK